MVAWASLGTDGAVMLKKSRVRNRQGAVMAEGVVVIWLIVSIAVASICLLVNSGMSMFYKQKIAFVAMQTASYTAQLKMSENKRERGEAIARNLLQTMGLPVRDAEIDIKEENIEGAPCISCRITVSKLPLMQGSEPGMMPFSITLGDQAVALRQQSPEAYVWLSNNPKMSGFLIPVVRMPPGGVAQSGLPYVIP